MTTTFTTEDLNTGDIIVKRERTGRLVRVLIEETDENIKNGEPGFDGTIIDSDGNPAGPFAGTWGYMDQVVSIEHRA